MAEESGTPAPGGAMTDGDQTGRREPTGRDDPPVPSDELARRAEAEAIEEATAAVAGATVWGEGRSAQADVCPFLRRIDVAGLSGRPAGVPDPANSCLALPEPRAQSLRQQQLVCLQAGHVHCPRYVQSPVAGLAGAGPAGRASRRPGRPTAVALGILIASTAVAGGFVVVRGGIDLPGAGIEGASPTPSAEGRSAEPSAGIGSGSSAAPPAVSVAPTPVPTADATAATPSATPVAVVATPTPTSSLLALLDPCPDRVDCYLYTVRRNDTLHKIADTFGVSYSTVRALNPQIVDPNLIRVGDRIVLPPPTR